MRLLEDKITITMVMKTFLTWTLVTFCLLVQYIIFVPPFLLWTLLFDLKEKKAMYWLTKTTIKFFLFIYFPSDFKIDLSNVKKPTGPRVYVLNHASQFDTFLMHILPDRIKYFVKQIYGRIPFIGWTIALTGNVFIKKPSDISEDSDALKKGIEELKKGSVFLVYPEGTKSKTGDIGRFKAGAFRLAYESKAEVVPVVLDTWNSIRPGGLWIRDDKSWMKSLKPYQYDDYKDMTQQDFAKKIRFEMAEELIKIRDARRKNEKDYYRNMEKYKKMDEAFLIRIKEYKKANL